MKIARCTATGLITDAPAVQNRASSEAVVHGASGLEEVGAEAMEDKFEVDGLELDKEDVEPSLEATLVEKSQAAGRELNEFEQQYVRLQFKRNSLVRQYPNVSARNKEIVNRIQHMKDLVKKFSKGRPKDDPLKLPFKSTTTMTTAEKKRASRMAKTNEEKQKELESNRRRMATPEEKEKTRKRMATPEEKEKARVRKNHNE